jgi:hypothetical protein
VRYLVPAIPGSIPNIAPRSDTDWRQLRSQDGTRQTAVRFVNASEVPLDLNWVDWDGQLQAYGTIQPRQERVQITYIGHPFVLRTVDGRDVAVVEPLSQPAVARINGTDLPSTPGTHVQ